MKLSRDEELKLIEAAKLADPEATCLCKRRCNEARHRNTERSHPAVVLFNAHRRSIERLANGRVTEHFTWTDAIQAGTEGFFHALHAFDPARGVRLWTRAKSDVEGAISRARSCASFRWPTSKKRRRELVVYREYVRAFQQRHETDPTDGQVAAEMGVPIERVAIWRGMTRPTVPHSPRHDYGDQNAGYAVAGSDDEGGRDDLLDTLSAGKLDGVDPSRQETEQERRHAEGEYRADAWRVLDGLDACTMVLLLARYRIGQGDEPRTLPPIPFDQVSSVFDMKRTGAKTVEELEHAAFETIRRRENFWHYPQRRVRGAYHGPAEIELNGVTYYRKAPNLLAVANWTAGNYVPPYTVPADQPTTKRLEKRPTDPRADDAFDRRWCDDFHARWRRDLRRVRDARGE